INPQYDLNNNGNGYTWHKTIVDARYFSRIQAVVNFDGNYNVISADLDNGAMISAEEYEAAMAQRNQPDLEEAEESTE
ncbi:MAG: hypothetical protein AAGD96_11800, partial [Chloroflexota bacterium]